MRDDRKITMTATPQDATIRVNMPVSEDAEASYDGPVKTGIGHDPSDGVPAIAPDDRTERSWDGPIAPPRGGDTAAVSIQAIAAVEAIDADAPTAIVTPLEVGYRLSILKRVAEVAIGRGLAPVAGHPAASVAAVHDDAGNLAVELRILRWKKFAEWVRISAVSNFVDLKSTLAGFPPEIRTGARAVLRQLTERCHEAWQSDVRVLKL